MKKLFVLFICFFVSATFAQSLLLEYNGETIANNDTIEGIATIPNADNAFFIDLTNNSGSRVQLNVEKEIIYMVDGTTSSFCLGMCYDGATSLFPYEMGPGESLTHAESGELAFHINYNPHDTLGNSNLGTSLLQFTITDETNPEITISFYASITYSGPTGIQNYTTTTTLFASPNPAKDNVTINYNISNSPAKLVVRNMVGATVLSQDINPADNKARISLANFKAGVYFYSIEQNNQILMTKKLIVK